MRRWYVVIWEVYRFQFRQSFLSKVVLFCLLTDDYGSLFVACYICIVSEDIDVKTESDKEIPNRDTNNQKTTYISQLLLTADKAKGCGPRWLRFVFICSISKPTPHSSVSYWLTHHGQGPINS